MIKGDKICPVMSSGTTYTLCQKEDCMWFNEGSGKCQQMIITQGRE